MTLWDVIFMPKVWRRLMGKDKMTPKGRRRLTEAMAERKRKIDILERLGLGRHAVENIYDKPVEPEKVESDA